MKRVFLVIFIFIIFLTPVEICGSNGNSIIENKVNINTRNINYSSIKTKYTRNLPSTINEVLELDLREPSGLTYEELENSLKGELRELAPAYYHIEKVYGINAVFKASQDAIESGWGEYCFKENNISGWFTHSSFSSKEECVLYTSKLFKDMYLTEPDYTNKNIGINFNGYTIPDISIKYNPIDGVNPNYDYSIAIAEIMLDIYSDVEKST